VRLPLSVAVDPRTGALAVCGSEPLVQHIAGRA
jgi:hypothetical protein